MHKNILILVVLMICVFGVMAADTSKTPIQMTIDAIVADQQKATQAAEEEYHKKVDPIILRYQKIRDQKIAAANKQAITRLEAAKKQALAMKNELGAAVIDQKIKEISKPISKIDDGASKDQKLSVLLDSTQSRLGTIDKGKKAFTNRDASFVSFPVELNAVQYMQRTVPDHLNWIKPNTVKVSRACTIYVAVCLNNKGAIRANKAHLAAMNKNGWNQIDGKIVLSTNTQFAVFKKQVKSGTVNIQNLWSNKLDIPIIFFFK